MSASTRKNLHVRQRGEPRHRHQRGGQAVPPARGASATPRVVFPDLARGFAFLYDLAAPARLPASVRVMDNTQFHFGQARRPKGFSARPGSRARRRQPVVTRIRGLIRHQLVRRHHGVRGDEGRRSTSRRTTLHRIAAQHGHEGGAANGERGYQLTFGIARVSAISRSSTGRSRRASRRACPWSRALELYEAGAPARPARARAARACLASRSSPAVSPRSTPRGCPSTSISASTPRGVDDPVRHYSEMEHAARGEILAAGGSLSHHHGIGKIRQDFLKDIYSTARAPSCGR